VEESSQQSTSTPIVLSKSDVQSLMRIPKSYFDKSFKTFKGVDKKIALAKEAIENGESVYIHGSCGTGKTLLAVCLMRYWWANFNPNKEIYPVFINVLDLLSSIKQSWSDNQKVQGDYETYIVEYYRDSPFIVFDDIGIGSWTDWAAGIIYRIINKRSEQEGITIVTSNYGSKELADKIDDRIVSRLHGMGIAIELTGKDWRIS